MAIPIEPFPYRNATDEAYNALNDCRNRLRAEKLPDDPPVLLEEQITAFQTSPPHVDYSVWVAWDDELPAAVGYGEIWLPLEDNLHLAEVNIEVLGSHRRQGIARQLLLPVLEVAQRGNRRLLLGNTTDRIPAGEAFLERLGAQRGLASHTNQLLIADVDRALLRHWQEQAAERAADFELGLWEGPYPEEDLEAIVALYDLLNQQPLGDLDVEDARYTAAQLRHSEDSIFARGYERWTYYARETASGQFSGYTEVFWNRNRPQYIQQGMTGVFPEFRNRGLGRWLKAAMMEKILKQRPQARYVRTGNADMNVPMLKINIEMGFKPYISRCVWQVETERVARYLRQDRR